MASDGTDVRGLPPEHGMRVAVVTVLALLFGCQGASPRHAPRTVTAVGGADGAQIARALFDMVNDERAKQGLLRLVWDEKLARIARDYSLDMCRRDFFSHTSPGGAALADRLVSARLGYVKVAENLGMNRGFSDPGADCVKGWLDSPGHRRNMLSDGFRQAGVGVVRRADMTFFFTMLFRAHPDYGETHDGPDAYLADPDAFDGIGPAWGEGRPPADHPTPR